MSLTKPKAAELFADTTSNKEAAARQIDFDQAIFESTKSVVTDPAVLMQIVGGNGIKFGDVNKDSSISMLESLTANKSMSADSLAQLNSILASQRLAIDGIQKDLTLTSPLSTSFAAFDLEAPAKLLTPRPTPLRNKIVRKKGQGTSRRVKRINGFTGTGTGGAANVWPGINESSTAQFGQKVLERGQKIAYSADELVLPYQSYSLSDSVSWDANFSGEGYQDLRQLSSASTLFATMLMEERMMLMGRGTAAGYSGLLAAPATVTLTQAAATGSQVATGIATYFVYVTADAGAFGESAPSVVQSLAVTGTNVLTVTVSNVVGALGYKVYIGTTTGAANAFYCGRTTSLAAVVNGTASTNTLGNNLILATTGTLLSTIVTAQGLGTNLSAYATGYDGILPTVLGAQSGFNNNIAGNFSTSNPGVEFQQVFSKLWDAVKGDPDEILLNGADRKQLSDAIKNGSNANYKINLERNDLGGYNGGSVISGIYNEVTGKLVDMMVHPWLPQGVAPVLSWNLPIPDTEVTDIWANIMVQDYMGIQWPVDQFAYEFSTYFRGLFMCYAPAWNGAVSGIASA